MNNLLTFNMKDSPRHIFKSAGSGGKEHQLVEDACDAALNRVPIPLNTRTLLAWYPRALASLIASETISPSTVDAIVNTATLALNIVARAPSLLPLWRDRILADPEAAEQLFFLQRAKPSAYPGLDPETIIDALSEHPGRKLRILGFHDKDRFNEYNHHLATAVVENKYRSAAWALEWLKRNLVEDDVPLEPALAAVLKQDEGLTCFAIGMILRPHPYNPIVWKDLESAITSPRWLYQGLAWGIFVEEETRAQIALQAHPAWLVEWLVDSQASYPQIKTMCIKAASVSCSHELIASLHQWMRTFAVTIALRHGGNV